MSLVADLILQVLVGKKSKSKRMHMYSCMLIYSIGKIKLGKLGKEKVILV